MSDDQQPEVRWAPLDQKPKNSARVWIIVGLVVAVLAIVGAVLFFVLPRGAATAPEETATPSPSASATATSSPTPEPTTPAETPPPPPDPSIDAFREQVRVWLESAPTGLEIVSETSGDEALSIVDTLEADAQRLAGSAAPSSIASEWYAAVDEYYAHLNDVRSAVTAGTGVDSTLAAAGADVDILRGMVGI